jgi:signal transduction histidine kinase/predicted ATPase
MAVESRAEAQHLHPLRVYMDRGILEPPRFATLATACLRELIRVHDASSVCGHLNPSSILVSSLGDAAHFVGALAPGAPVVDPLMLPYMAPEQTGRLHRRVDHRADLYSLGVIFYEMLAGQLPFRAKLPVEWVHAHLATPPMPLPEDVPSVLARILYKCLEKLPENRYQSAEGLLHDIENWATQGFSLEGGFAPGQHDVPRALRISRTLYGRSAERAALDGALSRCEEGASAVVLIIGESGSGKSALIDRFIDSHLISPAYLAMGRAAEAGKLEPLAPLAGACRALVRELLGQDEAGLQVWRERFAPLAWGKGMVHQLAPELEMIVDRPTAPTPEAGTDLLPDLQRELKIFFGAFARPEHPLILCLDDLQWADIGSLSMIRMLAQDDDLCATLWILAVRDDSPPPVQALLDECAEMAAEPERYRGLRLAPLGVQQIMNMLVDTLHTGPGDAQLLAEIVHARTFGNPLYVRQFLLDLIERGYLHFDSSERAWHIAYRDIEAMPQHPRLASMLDARVREFDGATRSLLNWLALIGREADLSTLARLEACSPEEARLRLAPAVDRGLLLQVDTETFAFAHDQVQQVCYDLVSGKQRQLRHDRIADALIIRDEQNASGVYAVVSHLHRGSRASDRRFILAEQSAVAGRKCEAAAAFATAEGHYSSGFAALTDDDWETHHELMWGLVLARARCHFALGHLAAAEELTEQALARAIGDAEVCRAYETKIVWLTHVARFDSALAMGVEGLRRLGMSVRQPPSKLAIVWPLLAAIAAWRFRSRDALASLPDMTDARTLLQMRLLHVMSHAAYRTDPTYQALLSLRMLRLTLRHGFSAEATASFGTFAMILGNILRRFEAARSFGELSLIAAHRSDESRQVLSAEFTFAVFPNVWTAPLVTSIPHLKRAKMQAERIGHTMMVTASNSFLLITEWFAGVPIADVRSAEAEYHAYSGQTGATVIHAFWEMFQPLLALVAGVVSRAEPVEFTTGWERMGVLHTAAVLLQGYVIMEEWEIVAYLVATVAELRTGMLDITTPHFLAMRGLYTAHQARAGKLGTAAAVRALRKDARKLHRFARYAPDTCAHKARLLEAEALQLSGRHHEALIAYEEAAEGAGRGGFVQYVGVAYESAALTCAEVGRKVAAQQYMEQALDAYRRWGAHGKVDRIVRKHPELVRRGTGDDEELVASTMDEFVRDLDLDVIVEVTRSLSEEVITSRLLRTLLRNMVLHAGASRGVILLLQGGQLTVAADGGANAEDMRLYERMDMENYADLPATIVRYVQRVRQTIVLADARSDPRFAADPYVLSGRAVAVICLPILRQGKLLGAVYLEHSSVPRLFTDTHRRILSIMGAQAAISLENAMLYETLEERIRERTDALEASNETLREINERLSQSETLRRQMISDISHDLRTPLTSIHGYIEAVLEGVVKEEEAPRYLSIARDRCLQVNHLIQDLLDLSKLDERYGSVQMELMSLLDLAQSIARKYELDIHRAGLRFRFLLDDALQRLLAVDFDSFAPEKELFVNVDPRRIDQVFGNLISNAIRHTVSGGAITLRVTLCSDPIGTPIAPLDESVEAEETAVGAQPPQATHVRFVVADTGSGIAPTHLPHVFERFYKVDRARTRESGGSGLGLAISKAIIERHAGTIAVESQLGRGTAFTIMLPIAAAVAL